MQSRNDDSILKRYEFFFGECQKDAPQYKYFTRPLYRFLGGNKNPLFSVPATFAITDIVLHNLLPNLIIDTLKGELSLETLLKFNIPQFVAWTSLSLPIAYHKHTTLNQKESQVSTAQRDTYETTHTLFAAKRHKHPMRTRSEGKAKTISNEEMAYSCFGYNSNNSTSNR